MPSEKLKLVELVGKSTAKSDLEEDEREIFTPEQIFYIPTEIGEENLKDIVHGLEKLEVTKPDTKVLIEVNTIGGNTGAANELALTMRHSSLNIATLVTETAYSAGIAIAAAGDLGYRFAYAESDFLLHPIARPVKGIFTINGLQEIIEREQRRENRFTSLLAALTGSPQQRIIDLVGRRNYMNAGEAQAMGIIDHIIPVSKPAK